METTVKVKEFLRVEVSNLIEPLALARAIDQGQIDQILADKFI
jgi:hypothetical protein